MARTISYSLLVVVESVLIYIFWGLSRTWTEFEETQSGEEDVDTVTMDRSESQEDLEKSDEMVYIEPERNGSSNN